MADRPPPQALTGASSQPSSSSSVPSVTGYLNEQAKASTSTLNTSPSGRLTFVFPPIKKSHPRSIQRNSRDNALAELPSSELLPSPTVSSGESNSKRRITFPEPPTTGPLKVITDDALSTLLGPRTNCSPPVRAPNNLEDWVASSRQTILPIEGQVEEQT